MRIGQLMVYPKPHSLFSMIRNTYEKNPAGVLSAYQDNAAIFAGSSGKRFFCDPKTHIYQRPRRTYPYC